MKFQSLLRFVLRNDEYSFRPLTVEDVSPEYVTALRRQREYLENAPNDVTVEWQKDYVNTIVSSDHSAICGLFDGVSLIGTAGLQWLGETVPIRIGILVLDPSRRGMGFGKSLVWASCHLARVCGYSQPFAAGMHKTNVASLRAFLRCGFRIVEQGTDLYSVHLRGSDLEMPTAVSRVRVEEVREAPIT